MLFGHDDKIKIFKNLVKEGSLAQSYLFFGESHIGKYLFAKMFANYLERGKFEDLDLPLTEALIISPNEGSIKIKEVRRAKYFLSQKPVNSPKRILIIDDANNMTSQAQDAILKITEEPPPNALILIITSGLDTISDTLKSRLQKIYFARLKNIDIKKMLIEKYNIEAKKADLLTQESLGKPGLAVMAINQEQFRTGRSLAHQIQKKAINKRKIIEEVLEDPLLIDPFITTLLADLSKDPLKNIAILSSIMDRVVKISDFTTNKRLQLEAALWNI
ncbi:MAG: hypothetical protein COT89_02705 [Candidatus Colwellbacteria bacterium CG10_big_fil_rev_8_21_14_0_10_42_22]|uniref:AAA+ ATPase domain-containing protein n=1 Tax=Candidatus Colwellbacteria bacterium CG10_big_fil_rev_8_21_14_0_10_42_22 TaxID=1974540 RepID=A0A2H0VFB2_9BACT|nr:MAG: hypothetical protein COT89_02705 [Candidatus Colwellbacteria bacterium CG10_big_fil_rev_8_21_14_0_10_42_22]